MAAKWSRPQLNMAELIDISNLVNTEVCKPMAEDIAAKARDLAGGITESGGYRDSIHVEIDPRTAVNDFAHSRVVADVPYAVRVESRHGILGRAAR